MGGGDLAGGEGRGRGGEGEGRGGEGGGAMMKHNIVVCRKLTFGTC